MMNEEAKKLNAETQRTQRFAERTFEKFSARLRVLCVSVFVPRIAK